MGKSNYGFLNNHFKFCQFELIPSNEFYIPFINYCRENQYFIECINDYKYGTCIYELDTKSIITVGLVNEISSCNSFEIYLNQLPDLQLNNVAYLFSLVSDNTINAVLNAFSFPTEYPSEFAKEFLKDTYGQVVYTYQLMELLSFCLKGDENQHDLINDFRKKFNLRDASFFEKLAGLNLPDGFSLYKLLENYTPCCKNENTRGMGFVITPTHSTAWKFIKRAKKYIITK